MKAITHKGEIGLVLSKAEATMFWRMLNQSSSADEAFKKGDCDECYLEKLTLSDFVDVELHLWNELDSVLQELYEEEK